MSIYLGIDIGTSGTKTLAINERGKILAQAVAEELHVPFDAVTMVMADTALVPWDAGTFGSQSTPSIGRSSSTSGPSAT